MSHDALTDRFLVEQQIGSGTFSTVKLATHIVTKRKVALKMLNKRKIEELGTETRVQRETDHLRLCANHFHLAKLYDVVDTPTDVVLVNEYVSGGELYDYILSQKAQRLQNNQARSFFQQIVSAVEYMHYKDVAHRDLKLENIMLDEHHANIKIADFGLSNAIRKGEMMKTACGSPHYAAPELIAGKPYNGREVDVWSCGVILYGLLCGSLPFHEESMPEQFKKIKSGTYTIPSYVPRDAEDLIRWILQVDTAKRMTFEGIRQHSWFQQFLDPYLSLTPEQIDNEAHKAVDDEVVDEVVRLYNVAVPSPSVPVTLELVQEVAAPDDGKSEEMTEILRDVRCSYQLLLDAKTANQHETTFGTLCSWISSFFG